MEHEAWPEAGFAACTRQIRRNPYAASENPAPATLFFTIERERRRRCDREKINIPKRKRKLEDETAQECEKFTWPVRLYGWGMSSYGRKNLNDLTYLTL